MLRIVLKPYPDINGKLVGKLLYFCQRGESPPPSSLFVELSDDIIVNPDNIMEVSVEDG